jgi:hypothetical protein
LFSPNIHTVQMYGVLCVECRSCRRRASMTPAVLDKATNRLRDNVNISDMTDIASLPFRCTPCGSTDVAWLIPLSDAEAERFVAGGSVSTTLASRPAPTGCGGSELGR